MALSLSAASSRSEGCGSWGERFERWLDTACVFASTLVDRIVTGYPKDEIEQIWTKLGYEDRLLVAGEPFALWVIEAERDVAGELPLAQCGLPLSSQLIRSLTSSERCAF